MAEWSNPRKVTTSGGMIVVSLDKGTLADSPLEKGDRVRLKPTDDGFEARKVTMEFTGEGSA